MTLAIDHAGATAREPRSRAGREVRWQSRSFRLFVAGLVALLASAWGGIVPFVGPTFAFSPDGAGSWYWDLSHALLALVPGAVGCLIGLSLMGYSMSRSRTFLGLGLIGLLAVASGAWFAIGPLAWPVLYGTRAYFVAADPLRELAYIVGCAVGPGLILAVAGGIAWGSETATTTAGSADEVAPAGVATSAAGGGSAAAGVGTAESGSVATAGSAPRPVPEAPTHSAGEAPPRPEEAGGATMPE